MAIDAMCAKNLKRNTYNQAPLIARSRYKNLVSSVRK